eukprot:12060749-Ditylum_brightwellii.AAC.1
MKQIESLMETSIKNIKQGVGNIKATMNSMIVSIKHDMGTLKVDVETDIGSRSSEKSSMATKNK